MSFRSATPTRRREERERLKPSAAAIVATPIATIVYRFTFFIEFSCIAPETNAL